MTSRSHQLVEELSARIAELEAHLALEHSDENTYMALKARIAELEAALREIEANPYVQGDAAGIQSIARDAVEGPRKRRLEDWERMDAQMHHVEDRARIAELEAENARLREGHDAFRRGVDTQVAELRKALNVLQGKANVLQGKAERLQRHHGEHHDDAMKEAAEIERLRAQMSGLATENTRWRAALERITRMSQSALPGHESPADIARTVLQPPKGDE